MNKKHLRFGIISVLIIFMGVLVSQFFIAQTQAATLTPSKVTITDSRQGKTGVGHTFNFTTATTGIIKTVLIEYVTTPTGSTVPPGLITTSAVQGAPTGLSTSTSNVTTNGTITLTVTTPVSINSGIAITIPYTVVTNPTTDNTTTFVRITTKDGGAVTIDTATVAFAILTSTSISMSATVDPTFQFSLVAVSSGGTVNSATTNVTTTASTIPFGVLAAGTPKIAAIDTTVVSNAGVGYTVTIAAAANPPLADGTNNIDYFTGTNLAPTAWSTPAGSAASVNTGFLGYTTEESALQNGTPARFTTGPPKWAGLITTAEEVVYLAGGTATRTKRVGFEADVNGLQPSGSYTGTVLLVATPTY